MRIRAGCPSIPIVWSSALTKEIAKFWKNTVFSDQIGIEISHFHILIMKKTDEHVLKHVYDSLDQELIGLLRRDGRAPLAKIATRLGVSRGTVQNRIDRLLSSGALLGFTVRVREDVEIGVVRAIMSIEVGRQSTTKIITKLRGIPELHQLHTTNGSWDLVAEIRAASLTDFDRVLREVRSLEGVINSETSILLSSV